MLCPSHTVFEAYNIPHGVDLTLLRLQTRTLRLREVTRLPDTTFKLGRRCKPTLLLSGSTNGSPTTKLSKLKNEDIWGSLTLRKHWWSTCCVPDIGDTDEWDILPAPSLGREGKSVQIIKFLYSVGSHVKVTGSRTVCLPCARHSSKLLTYITSFYPQKLQSLLRSFRAWERQGTETLRDVPKTVKLPRGRAGMAARLPSPCLAPSIGHP